MSKYVKANVDTLYFFQMRVMSSLMLTNPIKIGSYGITLNLKLVLSVKNMNKSKLIQDFFANFTSFYFQIVATIGTYLVIIFQFQSGDYS